MKIEVLNKGLYSLIIDNGRVGRQRDGFVNQALWIVTPMIGPIF